MDIVILNAVREIKNKFEEFGSFSEDNHITLFELEKLSVPSGYDSELILFDICHIDIKNYSDNMINCIYYNFTFHSHSTQDWVGYRIICSTSGKREIHYSEEPFIIDRDDLICNPKAILRAYQLTHLYGYFKIVEPDHEQEDNPNYEDFSHEEFIGAVNSAKMILKNLSWLGRSYR